MGSSFPAQDVYIFAAQTSVGNVVLPPVFTGASGSTNPLGASAVPAPYNNCPFPLAFRDFSQLAFQGFFVPQNYHYDTTCTTVVWGCGGVGATINTGASSLIGGTFYALANCSKSVSHGTGTGLQWSQCLMTANALNGVWSYTPNANGSTVTPALTAGAVSWASSYVLHAAFLDHGCKYNGSSYTYCWLVSGSSSASAVTGEEIGLMYTNSLSSLPFSYSTLPVIGDASLIPGMNSVWTAVGGFTYPSLPACTYVSGSYYCESSVNNNSSKYQVTYQAFTPTTDLYNASCPATACNINVYDVSLRPGIVGDWDYTACGGAPSFLDPFSLYNPNGYWEHWNTALCGSLQYIDYSVSQTFYSVRYKYNGSLFGGVIPYGSAYYGGSSYIGDTWAAIVGDEFIMGGNFDNGANQSQGYTGTMRNY